MITLVRKLTVSQTLFLTHLLLAAVTISGMSIARYESEWERQVYFSATLAKQALQAHVESFSQSVGNASYASMTLPSVNNHFALMGNVMFVEVSGVSDIGHKSVIVRYVPRTATVWRADLRQADLYKSVSKVNKLEYLLNQLDTQDTLQSRKLEYLLEKARADHHLVKSSSQISSQFVLDWHKPNQLETDYLLDSHQYILHIVLPLNNKQGGSIWAVFDAKELKEVQVNLAKTIIREACIAIILALVVVFWTVYWIAQPLKKLATSMTTSLNYRDLDGYPELQRGDEIGQLTRAYRALLLKIDQQFDSLRAKSNADSLTGLGSRYKYTNTVIPYLQRHLATDRVVGLMICDIDNFKAYNDIYGHMEGDKALIKVATQLESKLTNVDLAFRYGGEEFVILCCRRNIEELEHVGEMLRRSVETTTIEHKGNTQHDVVTVSIGGSFAQVNRAQYINVEFERLAESLFKSADQMMYQCKSSGRNRIKWTESPELTL